MNRLLISVLLLAAFGLALSQSNRLAVSLVMPDGSYAPFFLSEVHGTYNIRYFTSPTHNATRSSYGTVFALVGGGQQQIPITSLARADLLEPGTETIWQFTTTDGRVFPGGPGGNVFLQIYGTNQFGGNEWLDSYALRPGGQPFIGIIFDEGAAARTGGSSSQPAARVDVDSVTLRNGDILSGTILTGEFTVQASYGTLTFTSEQLASITIEDAAGKTDQFVMKVGDRVSGVLQNTTIEMTLTTGATIALEKGNIASITFATED